jgi:hypothetical protein
VSEHALSLAQENKDFKEKLSSMGGVGDTGLEGALFGLLDRENDDVLCSHVRDTLLSMLQAMASDCLTRWLLLVKDVLQASSGEFIHRGIQAYSPLVIFTESSTLNSPVEEDADGGTKDEEDDGGVLHANSDKDMNKPMVAPRWPTRVFAIDCLLKIMAACDGTPLHFDLIKARELKMKNKCEFCLNLLNVTSHLTDFHSRLLGATSFRVGPHGIHCCYFGQ